MEFARTQTCVIVACVVGTICAQASAQMYPIKSVRIVYTASPGGNVDLITRATAKRLTEALGKTFLVESRPGGSGIIAHELIAKSAPDGYNLLVTPAGSHTINPSLFNKLPYETERDFAAVSIIARGPLVLVAHPSLGVASLQALVTLAKSKPAQIVAATGGNGTAGHLALELLMIRSGVRFLQVPYKGNAPGLVDTLAGHTHIMIDTPSTSLPLIRAKRLRGLAMTSLVRASMLPEVPTVAESGYPGYEASVHICLLGPAGMPQEIIDKLAAEVRAMSNQPELRRSFADQGVELVGSTPEELRAFITGDVARWKAVIRDSGIRIE